MKNIKKHFHAIVLLLGLLISTNACEDLAFGDKFLQKPPVRMLRLTRSFLRLSMLAEFCGTVIDICRWDWKHRIVIGTRCGWEILKA